jgi:hypothetical protein
MRATEGSMSVRSHAKASSAGSTMPTGKSRVRTGSVFACLLGLLAFAGSSAPAALAADPPLAETEGATAISDTGATLNGRVNPNGVAVTTCRFQYGTTAAYGAVIPCEPASLGTGSANVFVSATIDALEPGTTYHYRVIATNASGAGIGVDQTFTTTGAPACSNAERRLEQGIGVIQLPGCMALEQVSEAKKANQMAATPTISANGERIGYLSLAALAETPGNLGAIWGDAYVAERGAQGWATAPTSPPHPVTMGWGGGDNIVARSFDPKLSRWLIIGSTVAQFFDGVAHLYQGSLGGGFEALSPLLSPVSVGNGVPPLKVAEAQLEGVSADHRRALFTMGEAAARYLPTDPTLAGGGILQNVYVAGLDTGQQPSLELLARDKDGKNWGGNCGARLGSNSGSFWKNQGAVSADGSRIYFSTRADQPEAGNCSESSKLRILTREENPAGVEISELIASECDREAPDPLCSTTDGDDLYQGASVDQSKVYFTTNRQLADSDRDGEGFFSACVGFLVGGCDLYLYDAGQPAGERLTQVSAGEVATGHPTPGSGAEVQGAVAISGDGSHVYFAATGVLTPDANPAGKTADEYPVSTPKLYAWDTDTEVVRFVGPLAASDAASLWSGPGTFYNQAYPVPVTGTDLSGAEVGGAGDKLFFLSNAELTPSDADGAGRDAYRYDAAATPPTLECVSCRAGGPDAQPFSVTVRGSAAHKTGTAFAEAGRWVSEDGQSALVQTAATLTATDTNAGARDDYLWQADKLTLLPGTTFSGGTAGISVRPPVLSHSGEQVAFNAYEPLLPSDGDTALDVYVARVGGGFPFPEPAADCVGEACRSTADSQPAQQGAAASESAASRGNVAPEVTRADCSSQARRAANLSRRAKALRRSAAKAPNPAAKRRASRQARRVAKRAKRVSAGAKRCRRANRRATR